MNLESCCRGAACAIRIYRSFKTVTDWIRPKSETSTKILKSVTSSFSCAVKTLESAFLQGKRLSNETNQTIDVLGVCLVVR